MGNNFIINKSGLPIEEIENKFGAVPEQITVAQNSQEFFCKEPEFNVVEGRLQGGDLEAMKAFERLSQINAKEESAQEEASSVVAEVAPEPCC